MSNPSILTVTSDVAQNHFEIEIAGWGSDGREVPYEGGPWTGPASTFAEFQEAMLRQIAQGIGLEPIHQGRKTCLSCGAYQSIDGTLPCDH